MKTYFFPGSLTLHIKIEYKSAYLSFLNVPSISLNSQNEKQ